MDLRKLISGLLAVALVVVFTLVALGELSWITFWVMSAALLIYVTYVLPSEDELDAT